MSRDISPYDLDEVHQAMRERKIVREARENERRKRLIERMESFGDDISPYDMSVMALINGRSRQNDL